MTDQSLNGTKPTYYITTAIPYVNARPHIGQRKGVVQASGEMRALRFDKYVVALAGCQEILFRIERRGQ